MRRMKSKDSRITALQNEENVLRAIHRFGWLRTRDLAGLLWRQWQRTPPEQPSLRPVTTTASSLRMAQRTLRRLADTHQVLRGRGPDGSVLYALAEAGARRMRHIGIGASSGKDLIRTFSAAHFRHRVIANEVAISAIIEGFRVSTEREIAQNRWIGAAAGIAGKKPDVLLRGGRGGRQLWPVEVERSRKSVRDYNRLLAWVAAVGNDVRRNSKSELLGDLDHWGKVIFICTPAFQGKLMRDLGAVGWTTDMVNAFVMFSTTLYSFDVIAFM